MGIFVIGKALAFGWAYVHPISAAIVAICAAIGAYYNYRAAEVAA